VTSRMTRAGLALAIGLGLALLASSQTPSRTPGRAVTPTRTPPGSGPPPRGGVPTGGVKTSSTPGYASDLYSIPPTTPSGMPMYEATPAPTLPALRGSMITATPKRPLTAADCGSGGWQSYAGLGFTSQKGCETWVSRHPAGGSRVATGPRKGGAAPRAVPRTSPTAIPR
jgi:hypothetical protein